MLHDKTHDKTGKEKAGRGMGIRSTLITNNINISRTFPTCHADGAEK